MNYFSGEPAEGLGVGSVTIAGNTISAVISRDVVESTGFDISQYGFNIWPRANGFAGNSRATRLGSPGQISRLFENEWAVQQK